MKTFGLTCAEQNRIRAVRPNQLDMSMIREHARLLCSFLTLIPRTTVRKIAHVKADPG